MVTGAEQETLRALIDSGVTVRAWTPGFFVSPDIGRAPLPDAEMAADPVLRLHASVFPGADPERVAERLVSLGAEIEGTFNGVIAFSMHIEDLRHALDRLTGIAIRALAERGFVTSSGEDTSTAIQTGEFRNGARPYVEAGIDGSTQVVGVTDTGLSLDAAVLSEYGIGFSATAAGPGHRKVVAYVTADSVAGGTGDLLTCDGTSGATHGHLVASLVAGNASEVVDDVRVLPGFNSPGGRPVTVHALDGVAPQARVYFIDDQVQSECVAPDQIEAQNPGSLSANAAASGTLRRGVRNLRKQQRPRSEDPQLLVLHHELGVLLYRGRPGHRYLAARQPGLPGGGGRRQPGRGC
jgi:hypothetical protein